MARTRLFDEQQALDRAMALFWRQGYEATSIQDLVEAVGINRASMYATFGDKRRFFITVLDHYLTRVNGERLATLARPGSALAAITAFFEAITAASRGAERQLGCLITNTVTELAPSDPEIAAKLRASLDRVEDAFAAAIRRGQESNEIAADQDPRAVARFLVSTAQGVRVLARSGATPASLREIVTVALRALR
ncbi:MAG TPA: TetR/AcrR family transcriptional regulator [Acetobacteraceae bacterium]|nr:TetR/AcrR family transcriptional regulator [Rhodocyclaceae bacterium]HUZ63880.1 TetR/AcrR family transcriptional regulator [Acetobacteraceae bacterium]